MSPLRKLIAYLRHDTTTGIQLGEMDAFRGLACMGVVFYHCIVLSGWAASTGGVDRLCHFLLWPFRFGWMGVDFFFFLSGFLLYLGFGKAYHDKLPGPSLPKFYKRRFFRIAPAYYASILILLATGFLFYGSDIRYGSVYGSFIHMSFLQNIFPEYGITVNGGVFWTLALEFQFYLILPFIAGWFHGSRLKAGLLYTVLAIEMFKAAILYYCTIHLDMQLDFMHPPVSLLAWKLDQFVFGIAFASLWLTSEKGGFKNPLKGNSALSTTCAAAGFALLAAMLITIRHNGIGSIIGLWSSIYRTPLMSVSIGLIIMGIMYSDILKKIVANPVSEFVGLVSYSLYIWHYVVASVIVRNFQFFDSSPMQSHPFVIKFGFVLLVLAVSLPLSTASYILFERPFLKKKKA